MESEFQADVVVGSGGALRFDAVRRRLTYAEDDRDPVEVAVTEAELRTWMTVLLLSSAALPDAEGAVVRGARLVLVSCRAHAARGEDPFTPLRARLVRRVDSDPPLAG